jgi:DNA-directed RNA polymerase subunit H (RpoH/RPB5)
MSVPDEFFQTEEDRKPPIAKGIVALLAVALVIFVIFVAYDRYSIFRLNQGGEKSVVTDEEKARILSELEKASSTAPITKTEKDKILTELKKNQSAAPTISEEDRQAILKSLQQSQ